MRSLLPLQLAVFVALCFWLWSKYLVEPVPDWHKGELFVLLPPADSLDRPFNQHLAEMFAAQLNIKLHPLTQHPSRIATALYNHQAHFSAIGMRADDDNALLKSGSPYQNLREQVVCSNDSPERPEDLLDRNITVVAGSAQEAALRAAKQTLPTLHWTSDELKMENQLLDEVGNGEIDCTIANEEQIASMRNFHPDMEAAFDIAPPSRLAWAFPTDADAELLQQMQDFFARIGQDGTMHSLIDQYYGYNERLKPIDAEAFLIDTRTLLPQYYQLFDEASLLTGIDWKLLAALAYRESHWDPLATSPTHVRGFMMLTEETADEMGVENRLDARESIFAGARHLQKLKEQLPKRISEPNRTWLALAAYNQGRSHLEDARVLAERKNLDPDSWMDVKKVMPQLGNPRLAEQFKHGNARGGEAVIFVETIRLYYAMLQRLPLDIVTPQLPPTLYSIITGEGKAIMRLLKFP